MTAFRPGQAVGPFRLEARLGAGGTGVVWAARAEDGVEGAAAGSRVALKLLHPHLVADADARARFLHEARVGVRVRHETVVATLAGGIATGEGTEQPWLALELAEGRTLREIMGELGRMPEPLLRDLAAQIAAALGAIHGAGLVHRDLKPGNVIITPSQRVRVMDLGIALSLGDETRLTQAGTFVGTLLHASPEQFGRGAIGPASDLYSLGVLLYEAATGVQPFDAPDVRGVLRRHLEHVPPRAGTIEPSLSPFFEELVAWLLEKDATRRPPSAVAVAEVLARGEASAWWTAREAELRGASPSGELRRPCRARGAPLVGRTRELKRLEDAAASGGSGAGRVIVVEGEAGVGKSRVVAALADRLRDAGGEGLVLESGSGAGERPGISPLAQALVDRFGVAELRHLADQSMPETPRLAAGFVARASGEPAEPGEELTAEGFAAALCAVLRRLGSARAVTWIVEDLHAADAEQRGLILALGRMTAQLPLLLVVTSRPGCESVPALLHGAGSEKIALERLSAAEVVALLAQALGSERSADRLAGRIARKSDGNPFFILEMVREMKDHGVLRQDGDGTWRATGDPGSLDVPSSVREILHSRLRDVRDDERTLLDVASVIGFAFDPDLVARVLGRKRLEVLQSMAAIQRRTGVMQSTSTGFRFDHVQLQEVVQQSVPPVLRAEYHALVASCWMEREGLQGAAPESVAPESCCLVAEHLLKGGRPAEGAAFASRAMAHLVARGRADTAVELASLALPGLGRFDDALRCDVSVQLAAALASLAAGARQREAAEDALAAARRLGDARREAAALTALGLSFNAAASYPEALQALQAGLARAEESGDRLTRARALGAMGLVLFRLNDYSRTKDVNARFVDAARELGDGILEATALGQLGIVTARLGDDGAALSLYERSRDLARQHGARKIEGLAEGRIAQIHNARDECEIARRGWKACMAIHREIGWLFGQADAAIGLGYLTQEQGLFGESRELALLAAELYDEAGNALGRAIALDSLATIDLALGRLDEARASLDRCLRIGEEIGSRLVLGFARIWAAEIEAMGGDSRAADEHLTAALALGAATDDAALLRLARWTRGRLLLEDGDLARAREALDGALSAGSPAPLPDWLLHAALRAAGADVPSLPVPDRGALRNRVYAHACLHRATGDPSHHAAALALLDDVVSALSEPERATFWRFSPMGRFVRWSESP